MAAAIPPSFYSWKKNRLYAILDSRKSFGGEAIATQEKIRIDLHESYGIDCQGIVPVTGGWLNQKWRVTCGKGNILVKQYSYERFSRNQLLQIEEALQRQMILQKSGVSCPAILPLDGHAIRHLDAETAYMVMDFCPGKIETPDSVTVQQLYSLGVVCGRMHREFAKLPVVGVKGYPIDSRRMADALWDAYHTRMHHTRIKGFSAEVPAAYKSALLGQETILQSLTPSFFERLPKGIGHEDFSPDNMLFHPGGVSAILDFDRNQYGFVRHDIGRAVLSFALRDGRLDMDKTAAFVGGYARQLPLTMRDVADALKITWCIENPWWIQPELFRNGSVKIRRFRDEILWLTDHFFELDYLLSQ